MSLDFTHLKKWSPKASTILIVSGSIWFVIMTSVDSLVGLTANNALLYLILLFIPVGVGLLFSLLNNNTSSNVFVVILLSIWVAGTIYMSLNGVRFILLLAPAFAISFGLGLLL